MLRTYRIWYLLVALLALVPAGVRLLLWQKTRTQPVDWAMAHAGESLFKHDWKTNDPLCAEGDGLGPVYNATSCVACHNQGGPGGGGDVTHNVTTFTVRIAGQTPRQGVVHSFGVGCRETLNDVDPSLPNEPAASLTPERLSLLTSRSNPHCKTPAPRGVSLSQRNTPALFGTKEIDDIPDRVILAGAKSQKLKWGLAPTNGENRPVGRALILANGRVGRFGWKAQIGSLSEFVEAACANELGLSNPRQAQPTPICKAPTFHQSGLDLTTEQCDQITAFCASLPRPVERRPPDVTESQATAGRKLFTTVGCADCHTPKLGSVDGIYSDLLLHQMGEELVGGGSYGEPPAPIPNAPPDGSPTPSEWRTPPLWGVADSAPYLHDGRAKTLEEAIRLHGGQGQHAADKFHALSAAEQAELISFLKTLRAP